MIYQPLSGKNYLIINDVHMKEKDYTQNPLELWANVSTVFLLSKMGERNEH
jgi:hypothetical protein